MPSNGHFKCSLTLSPVDPSYHKPHMNLYEVFTLGVNIKYRFFCMSVPPYGSDTDERVNLLHVLCMHMAVPCRNWPLCNLIVSWHSKCNISELLTRSMAQTHYQLVPHPWWKFRDTALLTHTLEFQWGEAVKCVCNVYFTDHYYMYLCKHRPKNSYCNKCTDRRAWALVHSEVWSSQWGAPAQTEPRRCSQQACVPGEENGSGTHLPLLQHCREVFLYLCGNCTISRTACSY